jgi:hypothetical protein
MIVWIRSVAKTQEETKRIVARYRLIKRQLIVSRKQLEA